MNSPSANQVCEFCGGPMADGGSVGLYCLKGWKCPAPRLDSPSSNPDLCKCGSPLVRLAPLGLVGTPALI